MISFQDNKQLVSNQSKAFSAKNDWYSIAIDQRLHQQYLNVWCSTPLYPNLYQHLVVSGKKMGDGKREPCLIDKREAELF